MKKTTSTPRTHTRSALDIYMDSISRYAVLTKAEEEVVAARVVQGDDAARTKLIQSNLRFVVKIAHEYKGYKLPMIDLVQEGNMGLVKAIDKFDPENGCRLISYAIWWIRAYIQEYVMRSWSLVKIGTTGNQRKLFYKLRSAKSRAEFRDAKGEMQVDYEALAKELDVPVDELRSMNQRLTGRDVSLSTPLGDDSRYSQQDMLAGDDESVESMMVAHEEHHYVRGIIADVEATCDDRQKTILYARILTEEKQTLRELASQFSISKERVRQIEASLMGKLKKRGLEAAEGAGSIAA